MDFLPFVLEHLPPAPARVLEVGCGTRGGVTDALAERGYEAVGVDPRAPDGPRFRQERIEDYELGAYEAVVAGRVLHHLDALSGVLGRLSASAPLLIVDEFSWDRIDRPTQEWYEGQHRMLAVAGHAAKGPARIDEWRERHPGLHPYPVVRAALDEHYEERAFAWRPYLYRWLGGPVTEPLEEMLVGAGAINAVGYHYAGTRR